MGEIKIDRMGDIPTGFQIYEDRQEPAGLHHYKANATYIAKSKQIWLELEQEPDNEFDQNAIKVIGCRKTIFGQKRLLVGYVQKYIAEKITKGGFFNEIRPRVTRTIVNDDGFVHIYYQLLGPKDKKKEYDIYRPK